MKKTGNIIPAIMISGLFLITLAGAEFSINRSFLLIAIYFIASLVTYIVYAVDKNAARKGAWRTPEFHLHLLALIGGWPGAMIAQQTVRHKSKKQAFRVVFWITVSLNCAAVIWLLTPKGIIILDSVVNAVRQMM